MEVLIWIIIILLFIASLVGVVVPVLPDTILLWAAFLLSRIWGNFPAFPLSFWVGMIFITLFILGSDFISNAVFTKKYGASRWGIIGALAGIILGMIFLGPIGIILGPFILVFIITYLENQDQAQAFRSAWGTVLAFFSSIAVKFTLQLVMIVWFLIIVF